MHHIPTPVYDPYVRDASAYYPQPYEEALNIPTGDFHVQVEYFNEWEEIWDQDRYESRINTEAELLVALEALRESIVELDYRIDHLEDCIDDNRDEIDSNAENIYDNDKYIQKNGEFIEYQQH